MNLKHAACAQCHWLKFQLSFLLACSRSHTASAFGAHRHTNHCHKCGNKTNSFVNPFIINRLSYQHSNNDGVWTRSDRFFVRLPNRNCHKANGIPMESIIITHFSVISLSHIVRFCSIGPFTSNNSIRCSPRGSINFVISRIAFISRSFLSSLDTPQ